MGFGRGTIRVSLTFGVGSVGIKYMKGTIGVFHEFLVGRATLHIMIHCCKDAL